jgi:hypothetical protein
MGLLGAAFIGEIVQIDGQQRRPLADVGLPVVGRVHLENLRRHDVLPTVVFKADWHDDIL